MGPMPRLFKANMEADASASLLARSSAAAPLYAEGTKSRVKVARMPFHLALSPMKDELLVPGRISTVSTCPIARAALDREGRYAADEAASGGLMYAPPKLGRRRMCSIDAFGALGANINAWGRLSSLKHFSKNIACDVDRTLPMP